MYGIYLDEITSCVTSCVRQHSDSASRRLEWPS